MPPEPLKPADAPRAGDPIGGLAGLDGDDLMVFHAGTALRDGALVSAGGRVLGVTGLGADVEAARGVAYAAIERIGLAGKQLRTDIGRRGS